MFAAWEALQMRSMSKLPAPFLLTICLCTGLVVVSRHPLSARSAGDKEAQNPKRKPGGTRLPDEGLRRAQQAEKRLSADKPQEAIRTLTELDKDFPGHAAVSLRLAQIYDQLDQTGPALFYYRRYIDIAGEKAREEATARAYALELMPDARTTAEEFGRKLGEATRATATPTPATDWQIAAARDDGALVPIKNEKELEQLAKKGELPAATPVVSPAGPTPIVVSFGADRRANSKPVDEDRASQHRSGTPRNRKASSVYADTPPVPEDVDAALALAFARGEELRHEQSPAQNPTTEAGSDPAQTAFSPEESASAASQATRKPGEAVQPRAPNRTPAVRAMTFTSPTPVTDVVSPRADRFFSARKSDDGRTTIRLINSIPEAVVTFAALPENGAQPVNVILTQNESRIVEVPPGQYEISTNISTINYPPVTLLEVRFPYTFNQRTQYSRRFTRETLEQVR